MSIRVFIACIAWLFLVQISSGDAKASEPEALAQLQSLPYAISEEQIYKVHIERIDGKSVGKRPTHSVLPGKHDVEVRLMLKIDWETFEGAVKADNSAKVLQIEALAGHIYQIAARVDLEASEEHIINGLYWEPLIYSVSEVP